MKYIKLFEEHGDMWYRGYTTNTRELDYTWLTRDLGMAEIYSDINHYSYGGDKIVEVYLIDKQIVDILDLTAYDMDDRLSESELSLFLGELGIYYDIFGLFDFSEDVIPLSRLVNKVIDQILDEYDGFTIMESDIETICVKTKYITKAN